VTHLKRSRTLAPTIAPMSEDFIILAADSERQSALLERYATPNQLPSEICDHNQNGTRPPKGVNTDTISFMGSDSKS